MTYEEIMKISNIEEKEKKLIDFYINEININNWLVDKTKNQKIRFKDRYEYKMNGLYHRLTGPSIDFNDEGKDLYYIFGEIMNKNDWKPIAQKLLRKMKMKKILKSC